MTGGAIPGWTRSHWTRAVAVSAFLTVLHTWPMATAPGTHSRHDNADTMLNEWIVSWVQHQLPRSPFDLFQGNMFYPARDTLAFSEPLIVPALLGAPVRLAGGSPVLVHNVLLLLGMTLSMLAMYALVREWTGDDAAALVAGAAFAFNAHTLMRLAHLQAMHAYGLPLALLAADRVITRGRVRDALWLAAWMTVTAYTSGYLVVFAFFMIAVALLVRAVEWMGRARRVLPQFAIASVVAGLAIAPLYLPYRRVALEQHMVRTLENVTDYSGALRGYLASGSRLHEWLWAGPMFAEPIEPFFPGVTVLGLTIFALASTRRETRSRVTMFVAIAVLGIVMSLGTRTPIYGWIYGIFPPLSGIRVAARFGNLFLFGMAALAGFGVWQVRARLPPRAAAALSGVALALVTIESVDAPMAYRRFDGIPGMYALLAQEPGDVVLVEQPFYPPQAVFENAEYVLNATAHWRPLVNGYSGYTPATYRTFTETFWFFPRPHSIDAMLRAGVTHVMVHPNRFGELAADVIRISDEDGRLEKLAVGRNGLTLYRLRPSSSAQQ
ncbi:MAG TPA: hypothetical protein VNJ03_18130 [Vicinamibacterales bacterium]|nr:hypothetical protein [Vicinamibacterales bacterium]